MLVVTLDVWKAVAGNAGRKILLRRSAGGGPTSRLPGYPWEYTTQICVSSRRGDVGFIGATSDLASIHVVGGASCTPWCMSKATL
jgi:hypothetical protein